MNQRVKTMIFFHTIEKRDAIALRWVVNAHCYQSIGKPEQILDKEKVKEAHTLSPCHSCQWYNSQHGKLATQSSRKLAELWVINQVCKNRNHFTKINSIFLYQNKCLKNVIKIVTQST